MAYALCYIETVTFVVVNTPHIPVTLSLSGTPTQVLRVPRTRLKRLLCPERTPAVSAFPFPSVITTTGFPRINLNKPDEWVAAVKAHARDNELTRPLRVAEQGVNKERDLFFSKSRFEWRAD
jgi:hypothetical protein